VRLARTSMRLLVVVLLGFAACLLNPSRGSAQGVIGITAIFATTNGTHIDTYSATEMDATTAFYYDAYVEGYLYQNGGLLATGSATAGLIAAGSATGNPTASGGFTNYPIVNGNEYEVDSYHYLIEFFVYTDGTYDYYSNPLYYLDFTGGTTDPSGSGYTAGGGPGYYTVDYIELGITAVAIQTGPPSISSISPNSGAIGSSGTITVQGSNLTDIFTQSTTPNITGSGMSISVQSIGAPPAGPVVTGASQVTLAYTIAQNASTGAHNITLSNHFGTSNAVAFNVGDPTPVITSVTPNVWQAGNSISVTITGTGFGTNPTLTLSGSGVSVQSITSAGDTQIVATISVSRQAPGESVTVQVQSNGYGNGFISTTSGQSQSGSNTVTVQSIPAPAALIMMGPNSQGTAICQNGTNIAGTQSVYIGQQIGFSGCVPQSVADLVISESWQPTPPSSGYAIGGFSVNNSTYAETLTPVTNTVCGTTQNCDYNTFYWTQTGTYTLTFSYVLINGNSNSGSVTFSVSGPTGNLLIQPSMPTNGSGVQVSGSTLKTTGVFVNGQCCVGISFTSNATMPSSSSVPPPGTNQGFQFVQMINSIQSEYITSTAPPPYVTPASPGSGLDNSYPYAYFSPTMTVDSPNEGLPSGYGEGWESFSATMYLLWDPALGPTGCTPAKTTQTIDQNGILHFASTASTCTSVPVPLSSVTWHWSGCAINTLVNQPNQTTQTTWILSTSNGCPVQTLGNPQSVTPSTPSNGYPVWGTNVWR
jgi:hypothetical protein